MLSVFKMSGVMFNVVASLLDGSSQLLKVRLRCYCIARAIKKNNFDLKVVIELEKV